MAGKGNVWKCLKGLFMGVNTLLVITAGLIFALIYVFDHYMGSSSETQSIDVSVVQVKIQLLFRAAGILAVAAFGFYGAWKEKTWPLIVYITACVIGLVSFLMQGVLIAKARAQFSSINTGLSSSPYLQEMILAVDCMLAINFVPAALGLIGIVMAAVIIEHLHVPQQPLVAPNVELSGQAMLYATHIHTQ